MISHFLNTQFLAFLAVGSLAAALHWLCRYLLSYWISFELAVAIAYVFGIASAFLLNRIYVFPNTNRPVNKQMRDFVLTNVAFFPVVWVMSILLASVLPSVGITLYTEGIAHAIAISIPMMATFLIYKFIAFKVE